ncbi:MAG: hypothetical protein GTO18_15260 [Anaerolineales bacterium]|nr:hypothetical protein [Anaerolineales bacterium]
MQCTARAKQRNLFMLYDGNAGGVADSLYPGAIPGDASPLIDLGELLSIAPQSGLYRRG